jgi:hypothetical protein
MRRVPLDLQLPDRDRIFRLCGAVKRDPSIEAWLNDEPFELRSTARKWFERMRACGSDVRELMHDGCPVACVDDAAFAYVNAFKAHVNVGFYRGSLLEDPRGVLEGSGKHMRHVKLVPGREPDAAAIDALIAVAYADIKARLARER